MLRLSIRKIIKEVEMKKMLLLVLAAMVYTMTFGAESITFNFTVRVPGDQVPILMLDRGSVTSEEPVVEGPIGGLTNYTWEITDPGNGPNVKAAIVYKYYNEKTGQDEYRYLVGEEINDNGNGNTATEDFKTTVETLENPEDIFDVDSGKFLASNSLYIFERGTDAGRDVSVTAGISLDDPDSEIYPNGNVYTKVETVYEEYDADGNLISSTPYTYYLIKPSGETSFYSSEVNVKARVDQSKRERRSQVKLSEIDNPGNFKVTAAEEGAQ